MLGLNELSTFDFDGVRSQDLKFPFQLIFKPRIKVGNCNFSETKLHELFSNLETKDSYILDIYSYESPNDRKYDNQELIGSIKMESNFYSSNYGDTKLFFKHPYKEDDFMIYPEWLQQINDVKETWCGTKEIDV